MSTIEAGDLADRMRGLEGIGETPTGVRRLAWTEEDAATREWFAAQAEGIGRRMERDPAGNLWALPRGEGPWWALGSHLDSVRDGGRFDGPLGVAAAFAVAAKSERPVAVVSFADEEGARFNTPTFGSRALVGRLDVDEVLEREDDGGVTLRDAMAAAGVDPAGVPTAPEWLARMRGMVELHIDQTRDLAEAGAQVGIVRQLASRIRLQAELHGRADHAGTTPPSERRDAMLAAAHLIVAAEEIGGDLSSYPVTAARIHVEPNALTTVPAFVRLSIDARPPVPGMADSFLRFLTINAREISERTGVDIALATASRSDGIEFDLGVREALTNAGLALCQQAPELLCYAGHDAGIIAERLPAGMVFVRNPTGVSHSPLENVDLEDAAAAATVMLHAVERLPR